MNATLFKVGDRAVHFESYGGSGRRFIRVVTIQRETKTQWVDDTGTRWRKSDSAMVPQYSAGPRYLMGETGWAQREAGGGA